MASIGLAVLATTFAIFKFNPIYLVASDYFQAIEKKSKQLNVITSPKVVLVGGSNLAFGVDSKMISDSLNMPVINMAVGAAFGIEFDLNQIEKHVRNGDIVIISEFPGSPNYEVIYNTYVYAPSTIEGISSIHQYYNLIKAGILVNVQSIQNTVLNGKSLNPVSKPNMKISDTTSIYFKEGFNEYGDLVSHINNTKPKQLNDRGEFNTFYKEHIDYINHFATSARKKGAKIFYIHPPYPASEYKRNLKAFEDYQNYIQKNIEVKVLGEQASNIYPDSLFFDTVNHLDSIGRTKRTEKMIHYLLSGNIQ